MSLSSVEFETDEGAFSTVLSSLEREQTDEERIVGSTDDDP